MADPTALLELLRSRDPYERVILVCAGLAPPRVGRRDLVVVWDECLGGGECRGGEPQDKDDAVDGASGARWGGPVWRRGSSMPERAAWRPSPALVAL